MLLFPWHNWLCVCDFFVIFFYFKSLWGHCMCNCACVWVCVWACICLFTCACAWSYDLVTWGYSTLNESSCSGCVCVSTSSPVRSNEMRNKMTDRRWKTILLLNLLCFYQLANVNRIRDNARTYIGKHAHIALRTHIHGDTHAQIGKTT